LYLEGANLFVADSIWSGDEMAKISIGKDEYERVLEIAERAAKRTNSRVVVAVDRLNLQESPSDKRSPVNDPDSVAFS